MATPTLTPASTTSEVVLTSTGSTSLVSATLPYGIYASDNNFLSGAAEQVSYVYKKLGGDILDIEITPGNVYTAYEEACLEYSYLVNIHQAKNSLGDLLGNTTASFDHDGEISGSTISSISLKYPRYTFQYSKRAAEGLATEAGINGNLTLYSGSFAAIADQQDYDLQSLISSSVSDFDGTDVIANNKITIRKVYYMTSRAQWRFFAFYGGINVIGNMST